MAAVHAGNGLYADLHDFQITSRNTGLLTAFDPVHCDLQSIGAPRDGAITDAVFQELDLKTGLVRREWHALNHVAIADSYPKASAGDARTAFPFDFFHINTLDPLPDGSMLISSRNTWTIYKLDQRTGRVLTRIGGKQSTVKMGPGTATAWQHDAVCGAGAGRRRSRARLLCPSRPEPLIRDRSGAHSPPEGPSLKAVRLGATRSGPIPPSMAPRLRSWKP